MEDRAVQGDRQHPEQHPEKTLHRRPRRTLLITAMVLCIALGTLLVVSPDPYETLEQVGQGLIGIAAAVWEMVFPDWGTLPWRLLGLGLIVFGVLRLGLSLGQLLKLAIALGVLLIAFLLLWDARQGRQVAVAFSRVGGPTRVETAIEASRFWRTPPQHVVTTSAAKQPLEIMWGAAECAMVLDAPLLFMPKDQDDRKQQVDRVITELRTDARHGDSLNLEEFVVPVNNRPQVEECRDSGKQSQNSAYEDRLSTLELSNQQLDLPVTARDELAPFVVFAVAKTMQDPPDVAVALALAAHRARTHGPVSVIVVPRRLETDPELDKALREWRELVRGGVVLGETGILPEDTRALLRQVLTSTGQSGFLGALRNTLKDLEALIAVLLALFGAGVAAQVAPEIVRQYELVGRRPIMTRLSETFSPPGGKPSTPDGRDSTSPPGQPKTPTAVPSSQRDAWAAVPASRQVTVWLRSGWSVTGIKEQVDPPTVVKLNEATFVRQGDKSERRAEIVFASVDDIELIAVGHKETVEPPASAEPSPASEEAPPASEEP